MMNRKEAYETGLCILTEAGIDEARTDTLWLLEDICHLTRSDIYAHEEELLEPTLATAYLEALDKRKRHFPVQQITGMQNFMGLSFRVNENVLIPRFDTEILVEEVLKELQDGYHILDLCTGSGCILLSLLHYSNHCQGTGADISVKALEVARENASGLGIAAEFTESDLFENIKEKYDIIVSNPPYIKTKVIETLMEEVRDHEPMLALDGKEDGLFFYRRIIEESAKYLNGGGRLFFEIGYNQGEEVSSLMEQKSYQDVKIIKDYAGLDRVVSGILFGGSKDV